MLDKRDITLATSALENLHVTAWNNEFNALRCTLVRESPNDRTASDGSNVYILHGCRERRVRGFEHTFNWHLHGEGNIALV